MIITGSAIKTYLDKGERAWYYQYVLQRGPKAPSVPLEIGKNYHRAMEIHFNGMALSEAVDAVSESVAKQVNSLYLANMTKLGDDIKKEWASLATLIPYWQPKFDMETIGVEMVLEAPLGSHTLRGTLDRLVKYEGTFYHYQLKTMSDRSNVEQMKTLAGSDIHEIIYEELAKYNKYEPYGGSFFDIIRKIKLFHATHKCKTCKGEHFEGKNQFGDMFCTPCDGTGRKKLHEPVEAFHQDFIPLVPGISEPMLKSIEKIADRMQFIDREPSTYWFPPCTSTCRSGMFGNSLCRYLPVCSGEASIEDDTLYMDIEDPYLARLKCR